MNNLSIRIRKFKKKKQKIKPRKGKETINLGQSVNEMAYKYTIQKFSNAKIQFSERLKTNKPQVSWLRGKKSKTGKAQISNIKNEQGI